MKLDRLNVGAVKCCWCIPMVLHQLDVPLAVMWRKLENTTGVLHGLCSRGNRPLPTPFIKFLILVHKFSVATKYLSWIALHLYCTWRAMAGMDTSWCLLLKESCRMELQCFSNKHYDSMDVVGKFHSPISQFFWRQCIEVIQFKRLLIHGWIGHVRLAMSTF